LGLFVAWTITETKADSFAALRNDNKRTGNGHDVRTGNGNDMKTGNGNEVKTGNGKYRDPSLRSG
jgi:hypothetical protein